MQQMIKPGTKVIITLSEGRSLTEDWSQTVIEHDQGLLHVRDDRGTETIYNMRSTAFHSVTLAS